MRSSIGLAVLCVCLALSSRAAVAHGIDVVVRGDGRATVQFRYTDGTPMRGAEYRVFAPGTAGFPIASGQTDEAGGVPIETAGDGRWRVEINDGQGHAGRARIDVVRGMAQVASQHVPDWFVAASLVANVLLAIALAVRKRARSSGVDLRSAVR